VFADVPVGYWAQLEIEAIRKAAITEGCLTNPLRYCPEAQLLRSQMAVFLVKAAAGPGYVPPACTGIFADVPCPSQFADWIEELYHRGITAGCAVSPLRYCPDSSVSNTQMAIFLLRSKEGASYQPPPCSAPPFVDVSCASTGSAAWIVEAARRQIALSCMPGFFCPDTPLTRAQMAVMLTRGFDFPVTTDPNTSRTVQFAYTQGLLTGVTGYGILSYYPNLMVSQITHGNGVTETQGNDPNQMRRPSSLSASGPYANWSSGTYGYDGAGNIKAIGASWYAYDKVNRLVSATLYDGPMGGGTQKQQSYTFDAFGNLTSIAGTTGRMTPTSGQTNRLTGVVAYDAAGNLTNWNGAVYQYDAFNQMTHMTSGLEDWVYLYTADDERLWSYNVPKNSSRWTVRDLGGKVLREYPSDNGRWSAGTDYIYRDGLLLAAETSSGQRHFHLDHLGTPRLITRASGYPAGYHVYYPFGEEATAFNQDTERMKFTGHERDLASPGGAGDDLDYMHARHESPVTGRFLSVDRASARAKAPQSWNRYAYTQGNPLLYVDPDGLTKVKVWEIGKYLVKQFPGDLFHGGPHYHIFLKKGSETIARVSLEGEVLTGAAPKTVLKQMAAKGLTTGLSIVGGAVVMFFDASPANAQDERLKMYGISEESVAALSQRLYGTEDTNELTPEQFQRLLQEWQKQLDKQKKKQEKKKENQENSDESVADLSSGGCFYHGCQ
jgi:RHS repeat-associated protein